MLYTLVFVLGLVSHTLARENFIVNGENVNIADYPWQGSYRTASGSHTCGCIFIGGEYVLTAGHCGGSTSYSMEFGSSNRGSGTVFGISSVVIHPNYDDGPGFIPNDITVVTATSDISGANISPATIPNSIDNPGGNGWITGWGRTCGSCALPTALQGREIDIISDSQCSTFWGDSFQSSSMICVFDGQGGACNGDSGGPMTQGSTVYGIASWVASGCLSDYPSTYARVGAFNSWVCSQTGGAAEGC